MKTQQHPGQNKNQGQNKGQKQGQGNGQKKGGGGNGAPAKPWYSPPETGKQARHIAGSEAKLEYQPVERTIQSNIRASNQRVKDDGSWWNNYLQEVSGFRGDTQAAYATAAAQQQAQIGQASALDTANTSKLNTEEAAGAALRGQVPSGAAAQREGAAQAQRNYLGAAVGGATAARGANQYDYLTEQQRIGAGQKVKSKMDEQKRGLTQRTDLEKARKDRGSAKVKYLNELRNNAQENAVKEKAFHIETAASKAAAAREAAKERREARENAEENRRKNEAQGNENTKTQNEGKNGGKTPSERNDQKQGWNNAKSAARTLFESKEWPSWGVLTRAVQKESEVSPAQARKAVERLRKHVEETHHSGKYHRWWEK